MTNGMDNASITKLRQIVDRVERIEEEIAGLNADKSDVYQEAKGTGFDVKALKALVAKRRKMAKDPDAFSELSDVIEIYEAALDGTFSRARTGETPHDPETGEITEPVEVRALDGIANAETSAAEAGHHPAGAPLHRSDPAPQPIEPAGGCMADPSPQDEALAASLRDAAEASAPNLAGKISVTVTTPRPYRVTDAAPEPVAADPEVSPLIADQAARMANARVLLGQGAAE